MCQLNIILFFFSKPISENGSSTSNQKSKILKLQNFFFHETQNIELPGRAQEISNTRYYSI